MCVCVFIVKNLMMAKFYHGNFILTGWRCITLLVWDSRLYRQLHVASYNHCRTSFPLQQCMSIIMLQAEHFGVHQNVPEVGNPGLYIYQSHTQLCSSRRRLLQYFCRNVILLGWVLRCCRWDQLVWRSWDVKVLSDKVSRGLKKK